MFKPTYSCSVHRWRNSFLLSLIFGVPVMVVMMYFMFTMGHGGSHGGSGGGGNHTGNATGAPPTGEGIMMVMPGLSLENLLLFVLCTPCQVLTICLQIYVFHNNRVHTMIFPDRKCFLFILRPTRSPLGQFVALVYCCKINKV